MNGLSTQVDKRDLIARLGRVGVAVHQRHQLRKVANHPATGLRASVEKVGKRLFSDIARRPIQQLKGGRVVKVEFRNYERALFAIAIFFCGLNSGLTK